MLWGWGRPTAPWALSFPNSRGGPDKGPHTGRGPQTLPVNIWGPCPHPAPHAAPRPVGLILGLLVAPGSKVLQREERVFTRVNRAALMVAASSPPGTSGRNLSILSATNLRGVSGSQREGRGRLQQKSLL